MSGSVLLRIAAVVAIAVGLAARCPVVSASERPGPGPADAPIVFVCEHGSVKSLMAASLFDMAAEHRGLRLRAVSRGIDPDPAVPPAIAAKLAEDGVDVSQFRPQAFTDADAATAARVVAIGVELPANTASAADVEQWDGVPAASLDYAAARDDLAHRIEALLDRLQSADRSPP